jgi:hypothetical protein
MQLLGVTKRKDPSPVGSLIALVQRSSDRVAQLPQDLTLPRVEHLRGRVSLPVLQEAHSLFRGAQNLDAGVSGADGGCLPLLR